MHRMIPSLASIKGYRSTEIEVEHHARVHGVSKYGVKRFLRGFMDMQTVYFLKNFRERPLHFMGGLAVALLLAGVLLDLSSLVPGLAAPLAHRMASMATIILACPIPLVAIGFLAELLVHGIEEKGRRALIAEVIPGREALRGPAAMPMLSESGLRVLPPPVQKALPAPAADAPRVLVVDDDPHMRDTLRLVLEEGGFAVEEAHDTFSALSAVDEDTAVVLLDMNLPTQRDGLTCLKRLRKRDADLEIVMVSGQQEIQTAIETMKMGACDYVVKPFDGARLIRSVQRAVQMRRITEGDFEIEPLAETDRHERSAAAR
jgi:ActR/RegA family two-component response regulator